MQNTKIQKNFKQDGRRLRSLTSQTIIVDALLVLLKRGILEPTAQQIANEAGISIRTVFRQIEDIETLFSKMNEKIKLSNKEMIDNFEPKGDLSQRINGLITLEGRESGVKESVTMRGFLALLLALVLPVSVQAQDGGFHLMVMCDDNHLAFHDGGKSIPVLGLESPEIPAPDKLSIVIQAKKVI